VSEAALLSSMPKTPPPQQRFLMVFHVPAPIERARPVTSIVSLSARATDS